MRKLSDGISIVFRISSVDIKYLFSCDSTNSFHSMSSGTGSSLPSSNPSLTGASIFVTPLIASSLSASTIEEAILITSGSSSLLIVDGINAII